MRHLANDVLAQSTSAIRELEAIGFARGAPMMQRAGESAAEFANQQLRPDSNVLCLIGPGNNGGDALVAAKHLQTLGHHVTAVMPVASPNASSDAKQALANWLAAGATLKQALPTQPPDLVIDGFFGIGLDRPLSEPWQTIIYTVNAWVTERHTQVLALDIPSGLAADSGQTLGDPIRADWTLAFLAPSLATRRDDCQIWCGQCWIEDLDLPASSA